MFLDDARKPRHATFAHVQQHRYLYLSMVAHAAPLALLYCLGTHRIDVAERARAQHAVESGRQLTEQARLEQRVHDMARIKSLLEESAAGGRARAGAHEEDDVQFSAPPRAPAELLAQARELARAIDKVERATRAHTLAKLLDIPEEQALQQVEQARTPQAAPGIESMNPAAAAVQIGQLEAQARAALARRRRQLERQQDGTPVAAGGMRGGGDSGGGQGRTPGLGGQGGRGGPGKGNTGGVPAPDMLHRIAEFTNPDMPEGVTKAYAAGGLGDFFDHGVGRIPDVGAAPLVKGAGRIIGPGGPYANRVYVNRWYLIGPFAGKHGAGLFANDRYPPEQAVVLDAVYRGKGGRLLKWEYVDMASYPLIPPVPAEDAVYYGYTELMIDREQDLMLWVGADDDAQLWLNDRLAWRGGNVDKEWFFGQIYGTWNTYVRDYNLSEGKRVLHFRKGRNKLFFKLANGPTRLFFSLVLTK